MAAAKREDLLIYLAHPFPGVSPPTCDGELSAVRSSFNIVDVDCSSKGICKFKPRSDPGKFNLQHKMQRAKPVQLFYYVAAVLTVLVLFHQLFSHPALITKVKGSFGGLGQQAVLIDTMAQSERIWQKTVVQRKEIRAAHYSGEEDVGMFPATNAPNYFAWPWSVWDLVPASYNCPWEIERIGRMGDGGKWVCGMSRYEKNTETPCILYSFGIQNESSFEQEMLERTNCEIFGYDFSVAEFGKALKPEFQARAHFTQAGISGTSKPNEHPPFYSIQDLMAQNGHTYIDILKIDVETSEFDTMVSLNQVAKEEFPIGQMLIELHLFTSQNMRMAHFLDWWEMLEGRGLRPTWTEPNLLSVSLGLDDRMPRLAEVL
ncbi:hypothetical protein PVAG01_05273 [Phlyctema vagabunda]|uniref:Methyltransferase domain-containing protein n=1 Tax=Phlyctema vagabunda TaxID=108571 RepID=A0ABR4PJK3_9HELO